MNPTLPTAPPIDVAAIRRRFPALSGETVYLENAGGSQVPAVVADRMREYMLSTYVQLGAGYDVADACDRVIDDAHAFADLLMNAAGTGTTILGPSSSQHCAMLAGCYAKILEPGDEVVITETGHEANVGPWARLAERGITVRTWRIDPETLACPLETLESMLNERTRIVAAVHVSNLLGEIVDVKAIADLVHARSKAKVVIDGVALAPHRAIDVAAWGVDFYVYSTYKVYGPHMAALFGRHEALAELEGPNHYFIPTRAVPYKFELGGVNHEGCAGLVALGDYLRFLASMHGRDAGAPLERGTIEDAFDVMAACERPVQALLLNFLRDRPKVRIIGPEHDGPDRVGTISFVHDTLSSREIASSINAKRIGIRHGHMYAHRLCKAIGLDAEDGVVRVSLVHYNTVEEIDRLIAALDEVL